MPSDNDGSKYRGLIKHCTMYPATRNPLTKALQLIASHLGAGLTTESTVAVGYWKNLNSIVRQWQVEKVFEPKMPRSQVDELRSRWNTALSRARDWEPHTPTRATNKKRGKK